MGKTRSLRGQTHNQSPHRFGGVGTRCGFRDLSLTNLKIWGFCECFSGQKGGENRIALQIQTLPSDQCQHALVGAMQIQSLSRTNDMQNFSGK